MLGRGLLIEWDTLDVARRVKEIDDGYFIVYSYKERRFEVHSKNQRGSTLALILPFDRLDARTVDYVNKTRSENAKKVFEEAERHNKRLERDKIRSAVRYAEFEAERAMSKGDKYEPS